MVPLVSTFETNLDQVRFTGLEFALHRDPAVGFGYVAQGALIRAYPYNISPCIYYSGTALIGSTTAAACTGTPTTNLAVINGLNFLNSGTAGVSSYNSVSNHSEPYSQGYVEAHWRTPHGGLAEFGMQYLGPNNSFNLPAFWLGTASARFPLAGRSDTVFRSRGRQRIQRLEQWLRNGVRGCSGSPRQREGRLDQPEHDRTANAARIPTRNFGGY